MSSTVHVHVQGFAKLIEGGRNASTTVVLRGLHQRFNFMSS